MTTTDILKAVDEAFRAAFGQGRFGAAIPAGLTPQLCDVALSPGLLVGEVSPEDLARVALTAGTELAAQCLIAGLDTFAPLEILDRPAARTDKRKRERAIIVYVKGWIS